MLLQVTGSLLAPGQMGWVARTMGTASEGQAARAGNSATSCPPACSRHTRESHGRCSSMVCWQHGPEPTSIPCSWLVGVVLSGAQQLDADRACHACWQDAMQCYVQVQLLFPMLLPAAAGAPGQHGNWAAAGSSRRPDAPSLLRHARCGKEQGGGVDYRMAALRKQSALAPAGQSPALIVCCSLVATVPSRLPVLGVNADLCPCSSLPPPPSLACTPLSPGTPHYCSVPTSWLWRCSGCSRTRRSPLGPGLTAASTTTLTWPRP